MYTASHTFFYFADHSSSSCTKEKSVDSHSYLKPVAPVKKRLSLQLAKTGKVCHICSSKLESVFLNVSKCSVAKLIDVLVRG